MSKKIIKSYTRLATDKLGLTSTSEEAIRRRKICDNCEHINTETDRCRKCGCPIAAKVRCGDTCRCPIDKW